MPASSGEPGSRAVVPPEVPVVSVPLPPLLPQPATASAPSVARKALRSTRTRSRRGARVLSAGDRQHDLADLPAARPGAPPGHRQRGRAPRLERQHLAETAPLVVTDVGRIA